MAASRPPKAKNRYWLVIFSSLSVVILIVMAIVVYLFYAVRVSTTAATPLAATPTPGEPGLSLPTPADDQLSSGPPAPQLIKFVPEEPIQGFSSCAQYGVKGMASTGNGERLQGVQIVVWEERAGLLALTTTDSEGNYLIEIVDKPGPHRLWVQVYQDDLPISEAVLVETQLDCQVGFQVYQINWQQLLPGPSD
jgi:hypothetical protein